MKTLALLLGIAAMVAAQDDLPQRGPPDRMEFEPRLMLLDVQPDAPVSTRDRRAPPLDLNKARLAAERAQQKARRWQQLLKDGAVSKVDAEAAILQAARAASQYEEARAANARQEVKMLRERTMNGEAPQNVLESAEDTLMSSEASATQADSAFQHTDLEFARNQLERQRKLSGMGLAPKSLVRRAQENLEKAKADVTIPNVTLSRPPQPSR